MLVLRKTMKIRLTPEIRAFSFRPFRAWQTDEQFSLYIRILSWLRKTKTEAVKSFDGFTFDIVLVLSQNQNCIKTKTSKPKPMSKPKLKTKTNVKTKTSKPKPCQNQNHQNQKVWFWYMPNIEWICMVSWFRYYSCWQHEWNRWF